MKLVLAMAVALFVGHNSYAAPKNVANNTIAVSQGISSPNATTPVNWASGFGYENAAAASLLSGVTVSLQYETGKDSANNTNTGSGAELGFGAQNFGIVGGYYKPEYPANTQNDGTWGAKLGFNVGGIAVGLGYHDKKTYSAGLLFNATGAHRVGVIYDLHDKDGAIDQWSTFGLGYTYDAKQWMFAVDASKREGDSVVDKDIIKVTPGFLLNATEHIAASVSYDIYLEDKNDLYKDTDKAWGGIAVHGDMAQIAAYYNYNNDWKAAATFWF